jgi:hypothetical protein
MYGEDHIGLAVSLYRMHSQIHEHMFVFLVTMFSNHVGVIFTMFLSVGWGPTGN